jgi:hypothetical protein
MVIPAAAIRAGLFIFNPFGIYSRPGKGDDKDYSVMKN